MMVRKFFIGAFFVLACLANRAAAQTVALDYYFNHETHKNKSGEAERFHYLWEDESITGFSIWGNIFKSKGATLSSIEAGPTQENLKNVSVYIIVDPDSKKESSNPNYITNTDADNIAAWVKTGGVLILMANDSANVELPGCNILSAHFGMHFNNDIQNHVTDDAHFDDGAIAITHNPVFKTSKKPFLKDVCSIALSGKAKPVLRSAGGAVIAATAKYGKGTVFAVGDPWLYNEYVNGRLPAGFDNDKAADDLAAYVLRLARKAK